MDDQDQYDGVALKDSAGYEWVFLNATNDSEDVLLIELANPPETGKAYHVEIACRTDGTFRWEISNSDDQEVIGEDGFESLSAAMSDLTSYFSDSA